MSWRACVGPEAAPHFPFRMPREESTQVTAGVVRTGRSISGPQRYVLRNLTTLPSDPAHGDAQYFAHSLMSRMQFSKGSFANSHRREPIEGRKLLNAIHFRCDWIRLSRCNSLLIALAQRIRQFSRRQTWVVSESIRGRNT